VHLLHVVDTQAPDTTRDQCGALVLAAARVSSGIYLGHSGSATAGRVACGGMGSMRVSAALHIQLPSGHLQRGTDVRSVSDLCPASNRPAS
jgi:hypothetical protein